MTGAGIKLISSGSNIKIQLSGTAAQVAHAITLLYNYKAIGEVPSWYDPSYTYTELSAAQDGFKRGLLTLIYAQETVRNGKHDAKARCIRAIVRTAHAFKELIASAVPVVAKSFEEMADDNIAIA